MSTDYYDMKEPWGDVAVEASTDRYRLTLWDHHGSEAGSLTLRPEDGPAAILHFFRDEPVCQTWHSGRGRALYESRKSRTATLVDEYGRLANLEELRKDCNRSRDSEPKPAQSGPT